MNKEYLQNFSYNPQHFRLETTQAVLGEIPQNEIKKLASLFARHDPWARLGINDDYLKEYFYKIEENAPRFSIKIENEIAGIIGLRLNWLKGPYLQFLGLLPSYQRIGLGSAALAWIIEEARRHSEQNVWVCASEFNTKALNFYENFGFSRVALLEGLVSAAENEVLLRFRL